MEAIEQGLRIGGQAGAGIQHAAQDIPVAAEQFDLHLRRDRRKFQRIVDEVDQHMAQQQRIAGHERAIPVDPRRDPRACLVLAQRPQDVGDDISQVDALPSRFDRAMFDPGRFQQIVEKALQPPRFRTGDADLFGERSFRRDRLRRSDHGRKRGAQVMRDAAQ